MPVPACWRIVAAGLRLKFVAIWLLLLTPLIGLLAWHYNAAPDWVIGGGLLAAYLVDVAGRLCCLAAPIKRRWPLLLSAGVQVAGAVAAATFFIGLAGTNRPYALAWAAAILFTCQVLAAFLFTEHLADLAHAVHHHQLADRARGIRFGLLRSLSAGGVVLIVLLILALFTCVLSCLTGGYATYVAIPVSALVLLPCLLLWIAAAMQMWGAYGRVLAELRRLILSGEPLPGISLPERADED